MYRAGHCKDDQLPAWWLVSGPLLSCHQEASSQPSIILGGWYTNIEPMNAAVIPTVPSGIQEPDEEDGFINAIQLASDEFDRIFQENIRAAQAPNFPLWITPNGRYDLRDWLVLVYRSWHSRPYLRSQALTRWLRDTHNIFKDTKSVRTFIGRLKCSGTAGFSLPHPSY
jgi:hypothetical protein